MFILPESRQARLELRTRVSIRHTQRAAQREPKCADQVPERDVPAQQLRRWLPPLLLCLKQIKRGAHNEAASANDLGDPVCSVQVPLRCQYVILDAREGGDARDTEDGGAEELRAASKEA